MMKTIALCAILTACGADVTAYTPSPADAGPGDADAAQGGFGSEGSDSGCQLQADCAIGDGLHDICYEYKAVPMTACIIGDTLPCDGHEHCGPFGWCDHALGACQAEGASACLVNGGLESCEQAGMRCCETADSVHGCSADCAGTALEP
jgi:hypothetical protein